MKKNHGLKMWVVGSLKPHFFSRKNQSKFQKSKFLEEGVFKKPQSERTDDQGNNGRRTSEASVRARGSRSAQLRSPIAIRSREMCPFVASIERMRAQ